MWIFIPTKGDGIKGRNITSLTVKDKGEALEITYIECGKEQKVMVRDRISIKVGKELQDEL